MKKIWSRLSAVQRICAGICIFYFLAAAFGPIFSPFPPDDFSSPALLPPGTGSIFWEPMKWGMIFFPWC